MRKFHQCSFCSARFVIEGQPIGNEHLCADMRAEIKRYQGAATEEARRKMRNSRLEGQDRDLVIAAYQMRAAVNALVFYCPSKLLKFKRKAKADQCGPKCWGAKKEDCACECEGLHHGIQRAPSTFEEAGT